LRPSFPAESPDLFDRGAHEPAPPLTAREWSGDGGEDSTVICWSVEHSAAQKLQPTSHVARSRGYGGWAVRGGGTLWGGLGDRPHGGAGGGRSFFTSWSQFVQLRNGGCGGGCPRRQLGGGGGMSDARELLRGGVIWRDQFRDIRGGAGRPKEILFAKYPWNQGRWAESRGRLDSRLKAKIACDEVLLAQPMIRGRWVYGPQGTIPHGGGRVSRREGNWGRVEGDDLRPSAWTGLRPGDAGGIRKVDGRLCCPRLFSLVIPPMRFSIRRSEIWRTRNSARASGIQAQRKST